MRSRTVVGTVASFLLLASLSAATAEPANAAKPKFSVSARASTTHVSTGGAFHVEGTVGPRAAGRSVSLQRYVAGKWRTVAKKKLSRTSRYTFTVAAGPSAKTIRIRVLKPASTKRAAATSKARRVQVIDCTDPAGTADILGRSLVKAFPGYDHWTDSPRFESVAKPKVDGIASTCGRPFTLTVIENLNVVGPTWQWMTSWIGY